MENKDLKKKSEQELNRISENEGPIEDGRMGDVVGGSRSEERIIKGTAAYEKSKERHYTQST